MLNETEKSPKAPVQIQEDCELKSWEILLLLVLSPPMGIYFMFKYKKKWSLELKISLSIVVSSLMAICAFMGFKLYTTSHSQDNSNVEIKLDSTEPQSSAIIQKPCDNLPGASQSTSAASEPEPTENTPEPEALEDTEDTAEDPIEENTQPKTQRQSHNTVKPKKESKKTSRTQRKNTQKPKAEESEITIIASDSHKKARPQHKIENSASTATPEENNSKSDKVYVTKSGKCYHSKQCGKGNFAQVTLEEAKTKGLKPCKRCFKNDTDEN